MVTTKQGRQKQCPCSKTRAGDDRAQKQNRSNRTCCPMGAALLLSHSRWHANLGGSIPTRSALFRSLFFLHAFIRFVSRCLPSYLLVGHCLLMSAFGRAKGKKKQKPERAAKGSEGSNYEGRRSGETRHQVQRRRRSCRETRLGDERSPA